MSILVQLNYQEEPDEERNEEILVFGYSCRLYRDDETAQAEENGAFLIPWMGDPSLMIDRYDGLSHLPDKGLFGLKSNIAQRITKEEEEFEDMLEEERYLSLNKDILEEDLMKEEEEKRLYEGLQPEGYFNAVGYSYNNAPPLPKEAEDTPTPPPAPPISSALVDKGSEADKFIPPEGLPLPGNLTLPSTNKLHAIIERTAAFIADRGPQMEIIIRIKQQHNPYFAFLEFEDPLNRYYKHLLTVIRNRIYTPRATDPQGTLDQPSHDSDPESKKSTVTSSVTSSVENSASSSPVVASVSQSNSDSEGEGDSDGEYDLHPLLRASMSVTTRASKGEASTSVTTTAHQPPHSSPAGGVTSMDPYNEYYSYLSQWTEYYKGMAAQQQQYPSTLDPNSGYDYSSYAAAMEQYQQYYASMYAQHQGICAGKENTHPYQDALSRLPQSVLDQPANPPPPDVQSVVDKMAEYAAKNGEEFERTVLSKNPNNPRFAFLRPGNEYHAYYTTKKLLHINKLREEQKLEEAVKPIMQSLKPDGKVGFSLNTSKLQPSDVTLEDSSDTEDEEGDGDKGEQKVGAKKMKENEATDDASKSKVDEGTSLQEREKQVERRRKAALFIEELRRKRERQIVQDKELTRLGLNEECEDFVGPKRPKT